MISGLYAITPEESDTARLLAQVRAALEGGAAVVQYRDKRGDVVRRHEQASELRELCEKFSVPLIVNDDMRLADLTGARGVHIGRDDGALRQARIVLGEDRIIGVSCYDSIELALVAEADGADYVAFGSFFPSHTKPDAIAAPLELLREARACLRIPIVAIGGITPDKAPLLIEAGAAAVAVISGLFDAPDIARRAHDFSRLFPSPDISGRILH